MSDTGRPYVVDWRDVEFTADEQSLLNGFQFEDLRRYHFLVAQAPTEGRVSTELRRVSIERIDAGVFVNEEMVGKSRSILARRSGRRISEVMQEIELRSTGCSELNSNEIHPMIDTHGSDSVQQASQEEEDEEFWEPVPGETHEVTSPY